MKRHLLLSHLDLLNHSTLNHPENSSRLAAIITGIEESPFKAYLELAQHRFAQTNEIWEIHDPDYIDKIMALDGKNGYLDQDTPFTDGTVSAALLAAGLGLELVEKIVSGQVEDGFALVRPPGHHARPSAGMGFCFFNNIAIAAKKALRMGLKRVLIVDWDVHHGNGTQEAFYEDNHVLFIDIHQDNLFPANSGLLNERGLGKGFGYNVNLPLPQGCKDEDYLALFKTIIKPLCYDYKPELILVSAGFDAHESDPLGFEKVTTEGFFKLACEIKKMAEELCQGKLAFFLEGGYNPYFLAKNVLAVVQAIVSNETIQPSIAEEYKYSSHEIEKLAKDFYDTHIKSSPSRNF